MDTRHVVRSIEGVGRWLTVVRDTPGRPAERHALDLETVGIGVPLVGLPRGASTLRGCQ